MTAKPTKSKIRADEVSDTAVDRQAVYRTIDNPRLWDKEGS
jgi:hypothetical protein